MRMKKLVHKDNMRFKRFKIYNLPKAQKKRLLEENKLRRGKRNLREIKEENRIQIYYKRIKIANSFSFL